MVAIAAILFNSYLAVDTADGTKVYELSPLDAETEFEDSVIFHDLFQSSVSDIIQLMVIKGQMETNGSFDPYKYIDITEFVSGKTGGADCPVTAVYELEDLIKWGKYQTGRRRAAGILCGRHTDRRTAAGGNTGNRSNSGEPADRTAGRSGIYVYRQRECHGYQSVQGR